MSRRPLIAGNWKMNKLLSEAEDLAGEIISRMGMTPVVDVVLIPPFTALKTVSDVIAHMGLYLGAQTVAHEEKGAFTGEISPTMLKDVGCSFVLVGHSERRILYGESNERLHTKLKLALRFGLVPIFCIGETQSEKADGKTTEVVERQLQYGLGGLSENELERIILAYEPVWAIGTGLNATPGQAQETHQFIREFLKKTFNHVISEKVRILYGGSANPGNSKDLLAEKDIDGLLVGGASLNADSFCAIIESAS